MHGTLIQIHYHDSPGGVRTVIEHFAQAFHELSDTKHSRNVVVCAHRDTSPSFSQYVKTFFHKSLDYHSFKSKDSFNLYVKRIFRILHFVFNDNSHQESPTHFLIHNGTLGKNCALIAAFSELAQILSRKNPKIYKFYQVIHDLPEENRIDMQKRIDILKSLSIPIEKLMYPSDIPITYLSPSIHATEALRQAGIKCQFFINPIKINDNKKIFSKSTKFCKRIIADKFPKNTKQIFVYPSRIIERKNTLESVLIASVLFESPLILGNPGSKVSDRKIFNSLNFLIRNNKLPIITGPFDLTEKEIKLYGSFNSILFRCGSVALSTSISEGFGYGLFEPVLLDKPLIARIPRGFKFPDNIELPGTYTYLPIPTCLLEGKMNTHQDYPTIDYPELSEDQKIEIIEHLLKSKSLLHAYREFLEHPVKGWPGLYELKKATLKQSSKNRSILIEYFNWNKFKDNFNTILQKQPSIHNREYNFDRLKMFYNQF